MRVPLNDEGLPTCHSRQVTPEVGDMAVRYSANNCWNVNFNNGNRNNNNTNNRYCVVGASESLSNEDEWTVAWRNFFKHHHGSIKAQQIFIHPATAVRKALEVERGDFKPKPGYRFPMLEPTPREIHAAMDEDKLVHYYVAPFLNEVAEAVHGANSDISHGNRLGHSAQTGAEQIRDLLVDALARYEAPVVVKVDFQSCFMSMPRERVYEALASFARTYYKGGDQEEKLGICKTLILHDPTVGCLTLDGRWDLVPERKKLENSEEGHGIPIGNLYAQLVVNIYLAVFDMLMAGYGLSPRFVDDKVLVAGCMEDAKAYVREARETARALGLKLHPKKVYIQPAWNGVNFCGRTIKGKRIYLSNRTVKAAFRAVSEADNAISARDSANSYLGLMKHCTEHRNEARLAEAVVLRFIGELYIQMKGGHYVIRLEESENPRKKREQFIKIIYHETWKDSERFRRAC